MVVFKQYIGHISTFNNKYIKPKIVIEEETKKRQELLKEIKEGKTEEGKVDCNQQ